MDSSKQSPITSPDQMPEKAGKSTLAYPTDWSIFSRQLTVVVLLLGLVLAAVLIGPVTQYVILAAILVFGLSYPARALEARTRLSYGASASLTFATYLLLVIFLFLYLAIPAIRGVANLTNELSQEIPTFIDYLEEYESDEGWLVDPESGENLVNLDFILDPLSEYVQGEEVEEISDAIGTVADLVLDAVGGVANFISGFIVVHIMAFFFLLEFPSLFRGLLGRIPAQHRPEYRVLSSRLLLVWVNFFRGTVVSAALISALSLVQFLVMGLPAALTLSLLIFVTSLIPLVGGLIMVPALVFLTFTQGSTTLNLEPVVLTLVVLAIHIILSQFVWQVIYPKLTGKAINLPVSLVLIGLAVGAAIGGFLGVLLAAPIMGSVRQIVDFLLFKIRGGNPYPEDLIPEPEA